jgi:hypothetical protein
MWNWTLRIRNSLPPFDDGREQMKVLAGLEVTTKSVEGTAEAMGADIIQREQAEIQKALQLDLPVVIGEPIRILYVQMDGTGIPVVKKETAGRPRGIRRAMPSATPIPPRTPERSKRQKNLAGESVRKVGKAVGAARS